LAYGKQKYQPAEPEYEVWWRVSEANDSQTFVIKKNNEYHH
jgi:hypothetical protein